MIRFFALGGLLFGTACATAPPSPEQLIVGAWDCKLSNMRPDTTYLIVFGKDGRLDLSFDGSSVGEGMALIAKMDTAGTYRLEDGKLSGSFEAVKIHHLSINGEVVPADQMPKFERGLAQVSMGSVNSAVEVLDRDKLILAPSAEGTWISCIRQTS